MERNKSRHNFSRAAAGAVLALGVAAGGAYGVKEVHQSSVAENNEQRDNYETTTVIIQPGETLYEIAGEINNGYHDDIYRVIDDIVYLNPELPSPGSIQMGTEIIIPIYPSGESNDESLADDQADSGDFQDL